MLVDTGGFVRTIWRGGVLTFVTQFGRGGVLTPFEAQSQIPCCHDHCIDGRRVRSAASS